MTSAAKPGREVGDAHRRRPPPARLLGSSSEAEIAAVVEAAREGSAGQDLLVSLLDERHPVYNGRGTSGTIRIRGYVMAAFARVGLPNGGLWFVLEELQTGRDPYLVAAAARALRGLDTRERRLVPYLFRAVDNIRFADDTVTFDSYLPVWPAANPTTALAEIFATFAWLGSIAKLALPRLLEFEARCAAMDPATRSALARAVKAVRADDGFRDGDSCCSDRQAPTSLTSINIGRRRRRETPPLNVSFEDQYGLRVTYEQLFVGQPSAVVFFYTRCSNPNKCSLTITKLGRLQRAIADDDLAGRVRTAAITYDPGFDSPARLRAYGLNRGVVMGPDHRLLRTRSGFRRIANWFQLGVNYGPALVNRHRIEAFVLDPGGRIARSFTRLQWDPSHVMAALRGVADETAGPTDLQCGGAE